MAFKKSLIFSSVFRYDVLLLVSFLFGIFCGYFVGLILIWVLSVLVFGIWFSINSTKPMALYFASYLAGIELLVRMSEIPLPHEFSKYAIVLLLGLELIKSKRKIPLAVVVIGVLLIPGLLVVDGDFDYLRKMISSTLSGLLCLMISVIYFYDRILTLPELKKIFFFLVSPLAIMIGFMWVNTPELSSIQFSTTSSSEASLYGPNQVSSILGMGILIIGLSFLLKMRIFSLGVSLMFLFVLVFRGLLTFSRGGMITPVLVLLILFIYLTFKAIKSQAAFSRLILSIIVVAVLGFYSFQYTNDLTGNALYARYAGEKSSKEFSVEDYSSGRTIIFWIDIEIFLDNPIFGVGAGMGKEERANYGYPFEVAAHNEFTRLLAEHGIFGLLVLFILVGFPAFRFFKINSIRERALLLGLCAFCFAFMMHSATRISVPSLFYGLAFARIITPIQIKSLLARRLQHVWKKKDVVLTGV